ncbi:helix-turn-helix domain-containing protein [Sphingomonas kyungheensis]|uniref:Helix-turn-helix domain-containing protein n=1 Tax=Sphingomonas kyungheensis TaxID=1069987 RepID=A0ABU8GX08_9SPHN
MSPADEQIVPQTGTSRDRNPVLADDLLSGASAAAAYLGIGRSAVYHLTEGGHLPVTRKGRRLFYRKSELDRAFSTGAV